MKSPQSSQSAVGGLIKLKMLNVLLEPLFSHQNEAACLLFSVTCETHPFLGRPQDVKNT